jgi:hypothetical protein
LALEKPESLLRVIDANLNRLREALRVIEEHVRFIDLQPEPALELKSLRHACLEVERSFERSRLLAQRDTETDPFSEGMRAGEMDRRSAGDVLTANFKRAQEAARVIEEYAKVVPAPKASEGAKSVRFRLYAIEKKISGATHEG